MASVNSPVRRFIKPFFYKLLGRSGYKHIQCFAKIKDIRQRLVEEKEMVLLSDFISKGDTVLDLGANYAYYTERMSKLVGENGKVIAFEPIPFTYEVCCMIVKKLKLNNVSLNMFAAHSEDTQLEFRVPKLDFGGISAGQSHLASRNNKLGGKEKYYKFDKEELIECQGKKLDTLLLPTLSNLTFIKIDIEGGEYFALKGMIGIIKKFKPVILVEIQPFFLKGLSILENELMTFIHNDLDYDIYFFNEKLNKLQIVNSELWDDNYLLIPKNKKEVFHKLIA